MVHFMFMFLWSNEGNVINCLLIPSSCSGTLKHHTYKQWKASATEVVLSEAEEALGAEAAWRFLPCRLITRPLSNQLQPSILSWMPRAVLCLITMVPSMFLGVSMLCMCE